MLDVSTRSQRTTYADCPACGYRQSLSVTVKDGRQLFHCHAGCAQADLLAVMRGQGQSVSRAKEFHPVRKDATHVRDYALKLWQESQEGGEGLVPVYLAFRRLSGPVPSALRFLPEHLHKPSGTRWPVMLAAVTDHLGRLQALHRTYLRPDGTGKAPVEPAKMTLGPVGGYAGHLAPAGEELAVTEGIETGLAVLFATGLPTWAALSAGGIRNLILPPLPLASVVTICADHDPVGLRSAHEAAHRWREDGRRVRLAVPPHAGSDFNDVVRGVEGYDV